MSAWERYRPSTRMPWTRRRVHRLHRVGFGARPSVIERDMERTPEDCIDELLAGEAAPRVPDFEARAAALERGALATPDSLRLQAWWVFRMLYTGAPVRERLALLWHDHFATNQNKVGNLKLMAEQNGLFREHGAGRFGDLLSAVVKHPALLIYLDAPYNRKGMINENLGRELLELFTTGPGPYAQPDVVAASRALTGWGVAGERFHADEAAHDTGDKTVLGVRGAFDGDGLLTVAGEHPATARHLARRLCEEFLGEGTPEPAIDELALQLSRSELDIGQALGTILRSRRFHSRQSFGKRFVGPAEMTVSSLRALELEESRPGTLEAATWIRRMGMELFHPPNVGGWQRGRGWFTQRGAIARGNYADTVANGHLAGLDGPPTCLEGDEAAFAAVSRRLLGYVAPTSTEPPASGSVAAAELLASPRAWVV